MIIGPEQTYGHQLFAGISGLFSTVGPTFRTSGAAFLPHDASNLLIIIKVVWDLQKSEDPLLQRSKAGRESLDRLSFPQQRMDLNVLEKREEPGRGGSLAWAALGVNADVADREAGRRGFGV